MPDLMIWLYIIFGFLHIGMSTFQTFEKKKLNVEFVCSTTSSRHCLCVYVVIIEFPQWFRTTTMHRFASLFRGARKFPRTVMAVGTGATLLTGSMLWQSYVEMQNNSNNILWDIKARLKSIQDNIVQWVHMFMFSVIYTVCALSHTRACITGRWLYIAYVYTFDQ